MEALAHHVDLSGHCFALFCIEEISSELLGEVVKRSGARRGRHLPELRMIDGVTQTVVPRRGEEKVNINFFFPSSSTLMHHVTPSAYQKE